MFAKIVKRMMIAAISAVLVFEVAPLPAQQGQAQPAKQPQWKDRAEYDLFEAASKSQDPKKALELLNQWKEKYPASEQTDLRFGLYITTYQKLQDAAGLLRTAKEWLAANPKSIQALYYINLLAPNPNNSSPEALDYSEKAARSLLGLLDEVFAPDKRPATTSEADWKKGRSDMEGLAHRTLGWVALTRKDNKQADAELTQYLKINPNDADAAYWLGSAIAAERKPETFPQALYQFARAACYTGPGAMDATRRKNAQDYLNKAYTAFHGDASGLQEVCAQAAKQPFPPPDFKILSSAEVAEHKEKQLATENPQLAFWMKLKEALQAPNGEQYFEGGMKGALVPPEANAPLKGKLIRQEPAKNPKELVIGIADGNTPEVTLKLDAPMTGRAEPGTELEFRGVPTEFSRQPFMVTFEAEKKNVTGWPAPAPPAKKGGARKGGARKKG